MSGKGIKRPRVSGIVGPMFATANTPSQIGDEITRRMLDMGLKPTELAAQTGISMKSISRLTNGHTIRPHNDTLKKIADVLGCQASELVFRGGGQEHGDDRSEDPQGLPR